MIIKLLLKCDLVSNNLSCQDEKIHTDRIQQVGKIEVECWKAKLLEKSWELRQTDLEFQQASKNDSFIVTKGE